jgi:hypothetical protein
MSLGPAGVNRLFEEIHIQIIWISNVRPRLLMAVDISPVASTLPDGSVAGRNRNVMLLHPPRRVRGSLSPTRHVRYWGKFGKHLLLLSFSHFQAAGFRPRYG